MNSTPKTPGAFVISLDFEINWGVRDQQTLAAYGQNLLGVRKAIPAMLELFAAYQLRVTWATVGLLFFANKREMLAHLPAVRPEYTDANLSPYPTLDAIGDNEEADPYHYGASLLAQIKQTPGQEVATHTFCHYYCLEAGQTAEAFRSDLQAAVQVAQEQGLQLTSLVFPRNQCNAAYLPICAELGITSYRGNEESWIYKERSEEQQRLYKRGARLLDAYLNLSGHHAHPWPKVGPAGLVNIPASRFLRPWSKRGAGLLEKLRLKRILSGMEHAAKHGLVYHLWWHPHNFGVNTAENIEVLRRIAEHFRTLQAQYGMQSLTMHDIASRVMPSK